MKRSPRTHLHVAALSHAGRSGKTNEDRYAIASFVNGIGQPLLLAVVSDGIGGHRAGEVAAELAVNYIVQHVSESNGRQPLAIMERAIHMASQVIVAHSTTEAERRGMGATCACVWVEGSRLYTAYVGDSRIYLVRDEKIHRLSVDHSWVQEAIEKHLLSPQQARHHPNAHVIRRYLGSTRPPQVDFRLCLGEADGEGALGKQGAMLKAGDVLLLCSDGLTDMLLDEEILRLILTHIPSLKAAAEALVFEANARGGHDNITVVLLGMPQDAAPTLPRKRVRKESPGN